MAPARSESDRFWPKVEKLAGGCWRWTGALDSKGYGGFHVGPGRVGRRWVRAHRWSYEAVVGKIPPGLDLDRLCRNRACVNPEHLEPVTRQVNLKRGAQGSKTFCKNGHEYTPENTYRSPSTGRRACATCKRVAITAWNAGRKAMRAEAPR